MRRNDACVPYSPAQNRMLLLCSSSVVSTAATHSKSHSCVILPRRCCMCSGAIFWAHIRQVVYGCSGQLLDEIAGPIFTIPCEDLFQRAVESQRVQVTGPVLEEECRRIHDEYWDQAQCAVTGEREGAPPQETP